MSTLLLGNTANELLSPWWSTIKGSVAFLGPLWYSEVRGRPRWPGDAGSLYDAPFDSSLDDLPFDSSSGGGEIAPTPWMFVADSSS